MPAVHRTNDLHFVMPAMQSQPMHIAEKENDSHFVAQQIDRSIPMYSVALVRFR